MRLRLENKSGYKSDDNGTETKRGVSQSNEQTKNKEFQCPILLQRKYFTKLVSEVLFYAERLKIAE